MRHRVVLFVALMTACAAARAQCVRNAYRTTVLVSNLPELDPQILDPLLLDAWGVAIRPAGAGGHWWINNAASGTVTTYVGDVPGVPLHQDALQYVNIPTSVLYSPFPETLSQPTGQVYTGWSDSDFQVSGEGISGAAKFVFVTLDGTISAWRDGMTSAVNMVDDSLSGAMFTGVAVTELPGGNRLYVCDFGGETFRCFDANFQEIPLPPAAFKDPRCPGYFTPWNVQFLDGRLYIAWARQGDDPGEEEHLPGYGFVSSFDTEGNLLQMFEHRFELNAPWGVAIAPHNFGAMSGKLLIGNFADGAILAYDLATSLFVDYLRDEKGSPIAADGLWGFLFGNGVRLGRTNHLYYAAGPNGEEDGVFAKLAPLTPYSVDLDASGVVDFGDLNILLSAYNATANADLNGDEATDFADLNILLTLYGAACR